MGEPVLADAQFGIVRILRPYAGFDSTTPGSGSYQDLNSEAIPIMMTEGGVALDPNAGQPGYAPTLVKGLATPLGARVTFWIPSLEPVGDGVALGYTYSAVWRMRNVFDYQRQRIPYHYPKRGFGVAVGGSPRIVIPAACQSVVYNDGTAPTVAGETATQDVFAEALRFNRSNNNGFGVPIIPGGGNGTVEQGLLPADGGGAGFLMCELQALGDELLLGITRDGDSAVWDFDTDGVDYPLSIAYGTGSGPTYPDIGVYVLVGSAP